MRTLRWVGYDTDFTLAHLDVVFREWTWKGITAYCKITAKIDVGRFLPLSETYRLNKTAFYKQLRHNFNKNNKVVRE